MPDKLYDINQQSDGFFYFYFMQKDIQGLPDGRYISGPHTTKQIAEDALEIITAKGPVFFNAIEKKWYFWDETWSNKEGPYNSLEDAEVAFKEYADNL